MSKLLRQLLAYSVILFISGCGGGGCGSCAGGAIQPIAGEYPISPERRIPHAMQIRLTDQGLGAVETIAPDLFSSFLRNGINVPYSTSTLIDVCDRPPSGGCIITVSLNTDPAHRGLELSFAAPNQIAAEVRLVLVDHNLPVHALGCPLHLDLDTTNGSNAYVGLQTSIAINSDSHMARRNYFAAGLVSPTGSGDLVQLNPNEPIETDDFNIHSDDGDCGILSPGACYCAGISALTGIGFVKNLIISQIAGQISSAVAPIQDALAASSAPPVGCPTGTTVDGAHCRYPEDSAEVPALLGTQGTGDFGALLSSLTPGLHAHDSFDIAAGDPFHGAEVTDTTGMTINVFGALTSDAHSNCVPMMNPPAPANVAEWTNLRQNLIPGTSTETDLGIGIAEEFMNSALWHLWDSGMFCLGVNTRMSQTLSTGTFTALPPLASIRNVTFPARNAAAALMLRPQQPPSIHVGSGANLTTDPHLLLTFHHLAIDFYVWTEERYLRAMTIDTDLTLPINLMLDAGGLKPTVGTATTSNTTISNSLLTAMPTAIASILNSVLGTAIGMFAGSIPAIAIPSVALPGSGGGHIDIQIPQSGIQGLNEGTSRYLALFANLHYTSGSAMMSSIELDTTASMERMPFDARVYQFGPDYSPEQLPHVRLQLGTPNSFGNPTEYTYRVDDLTWSQWTRENLVEVTSPSFFAQGSHHIEVRARVVDMPNTVDTQPARVDFTIDTEAPLATAAREGDHLVVTAHDDVVGNDRLQYSITFDGASEGTFGPEPTAVIPATASTYVVRVRDDSGNEMHFSGPLTALTIRGGVSTDPAACGCSTPGARGNGAGSILAALGAILLALSMLRRRKQAPTVALVVVQRSHKVSPPPRLIVGASVVLFFVALGCNCGQHTNTDGGADGTTDGGSCPSGQRSCGGHCVSATPSCNASSCAPGMAPSTTPSFSDSSCAWDCMCTPLPPLTQGAAGSHLDMAVATNNTVWLSAYSAGDPHSGSLYGDLVVGTYDRAASTVNWTIVDGVPSNGTVGGSIDGWRHGITDPGDDVGRWNSIALDSAGHPRVAYWDTTNQHLKFAWYDGMNWTVSVVDTTGRNGEYASLVMLPNDIPAIAYRSIVPNPAMAGHVVSRVRYARANNSTPHAATDWTYVEIAAAPTSCRAADCTTGQVCVQTTGACTATSGTCATACSATQACISGACQNIYTSNWIEDFGPGIGLFNSLALDSMHRPQVVYYDRDRGNLLGASVTSGTTWDMPFIIDGEAADRSDQGDRGLWASLVVSADNVWHVAYVDAYAESVLYTTVTGGTRTGTPEVVDNGAQVGATAFTDGSHIIGDSIDLDIDTTSTVRVAYQDSTAGTLRLAQRGTSGWTVTVQDMMNSTGYWARIDHGNLATYWRDIAMNHFGVRVSAIH